MKTATGNKGPRASVDRQAAGRQVDIPERTFAFAARVVRLIRCLPGGIAGQVIARQVAKSATSVGANVEEAQGSHSKAEFARRMGIARSEARETFYWLRLIAECELVPRQRLEDLLQESEELVKILTTIVKKTRQ